MILVLAGLGLPLFAAGCDGTGSKERGAESEATAVSQIREVLSRQQASWNRGDLESFMQDYWQSEQLRFASGGEVRRGWNSTLERYRQTYPDRSAMGTLRFDNLEIDLLGTDNAVVFGNWRLEREADSPNGLFTLLFEKKAASDRAAESEPGAWVIVADHTSSSGD